MSMRVVSLVALGFFSATPLLAQTAPCGRAIVAVAKTDKEKEERFLPAPPEHVKACAIRALPAVAAHLDKDDGLVLKVVIGRGDWAGWMDANRKAGVKGLAAGTVVGSYAIELRPESRDGIAGTSVSIAFSKIKVGGVGVSRNGATQFMEEIGCLSGLLSQSDPLANPRGLVNTADPIEDRTASLPEGTPLQVILRDPLSSKDVVKKGKETQIVFEVAADVSVDEVRLVRKGALGIGRFTDVKAKGGFGRSASLEFVIDQVTAVDGQSVAVTGAVERQRQRDLASGTGGQVGLLPLLFGFLTKGSEAILRAGTTYDVETSGTYMIRVVK